MLTSEQELISQEHVNQLKAEFGRKVELNIVIKNITEMKSLELNVQEISPYLPQVYSREELQELLS